MLRKIKPFVCLLLAAAILLGAMSAALAAYATIRPGAKGTAVKDMQKKLISFGYLKGDADGKYGPLTTAAVRKFQKARGLEVDGVAGDKTLTAIFGGPASVTTDYGKYVTTAKDPTTLYYTCQGTRVKQLQKALKALKYYSGSIDGTFGNSTLKAVIAFQKDKGLKQDGLVGKGTIAALNKAQKTVKVSTYLMISKGASGQTIKDVQTKLNALGFYSGGDSYGYFGSNTMQAVRDFQEHNNLTVTGYIGQNTYNKLFSTTAIKATTQKYTTLRPGDSGAEVSDMKAKLAGLGYSVDLDTDVYTETTKRIVRIFQAAYNLVADGIAGQQTRSVLERESR